MAGRRRLERKTGDNRPVVTDDFIYDEPPQSDFVNHDQIESDTPEEAIRKMRRKTSDHGAEQDAANRDHDVSPLESGSGEKRTVYSSGIMLDENLQPIYESGKRPRKPHPILRGIVLVVVTISLLLAAAAYVFNRVTEKKISVLGVPESTISSVVSPVQSFFSGLTETLFGYFRTLKLRSNLEAEYEALRAENEELVYKAMKADRLEDELAQYQDLIDEVKANIDMQPITARVVGKSDSNFFSTLTIDKGSDDGINEYMAVTLGYSFIGYTVSVEPHEATVRTILDSDASIAALMKGTSDQGIVRSTLGIDNSGLCRMYYLPDDSLPRPGTLVVTSGVGMPFPPDIPIGTVTEATRGMEANKQYVVIKPLADFQHLERVIVLRYKPENPVPVEGRENSNAEIEIIQPQEARPSPEVPEIASDFSTSDTDEEDQDDSLSADEDGIASEEDDSEPTPVPTETPSSTPEPTETPEPTPYISPIHYQVVNLQGEPTPTPTPTLAPTSTPYFTPDPEAMTFEDEEDE